MNGRTRQRKAWALQSRLAPYAFLLPFLLVFGTFTLYPLAQSVVLSAYTYAGPRRARFVGWGNFSFILTDVTFWNAVLNTATFAAMYLVLLLPLSLGLALLLDSRRVRFREVFRFAFFSTYTVGSVFVAVIFMLLLAPRDGLINRAIGAALPRVGSEINWKGNPRFAIPALVIAALWLTVGQAMIYLLAALQAVDRELYDAAEVDGAGPWQRFRHVTLPGIRPVLVYLGLVGTIYSLQLFELPYLFFQQTFGPGGRGMTIVGYVFLHAFQSQDLGTASAAGWVLVLLVTVVAYVQLLVTGARRGSLSPVRRGEG